MSKYFTHFDDMTWVNPNSLDDLTWRLIHAPDTITDTEKRVLASLVSNYQALIGKNRADRESVCRNLRKAKYST